MLLKSLAVAVLSALSFTSASFVDLNGVSIIDYSPGLGWVGFSMVANNAPFITPGLRVNLTEESVLKLTDIYGLGDRYNVYFDGNYVATSSLPNYDPTFNTNVLDPNIAYSKNATWSNLFLRIPVGVYNITLQAIQVEGTVYDGVGYVRVDNAFYDPI